MGSILLQGFVHTAASILYAGLAVHFWRTRWQAASRLPTTPPLHSWERSAILVPFGLHTLLVTQALFGSTELRFGFGHALSVMLWLAVLLHWIESLFYRIEGMQAPVLAVAAICAPLPALFPGLPGSAYTATMEFRVHLALGMIAYGLFTIAALHALLMALLERRLHGGALSGPYAALPPLLTMEQLLFRIIGVGFIMLTLTLVTGAVFSETLFGRAMQFNHKTVFAVASWLIFGALLVGRHGYGWRGRNALRWTLAGFVTLLLAYVGSRFVLEVILRRGLG